MVGITRCASACTLSLSLIYSLCLHCGIYSSLLPPYFNSQCKTLPGNIGHFFSHWGHVDSACCTASHCHTVSVHHADGRVELHPTSELLLPAISLVYGPYLIIYWIYFGHILCRSLLFIWYISWPYNTIQYWRYFNIRSTSEWYCVIWGNLYWRSNDCSARS